jgi:hypothetical protein
MGLRHFVNLRDLEVSVDRQVPPFDRSMRLQDPEVQVMREKTLCQIDICGLQFVFPPFIVHGSVPSTSLKAAQLHYEQGLKELSAIALKGIAGCRDATPATGIGASNEASRSRSTKGHAMDDQSLMLFRTTSGEVLVGDSLDSVGFA